MLVYSDPLVCYNVLLLGCAKFELYEYLYEFKKLIYEQEYFEELLKECEKSLDTCIELNKDHKTTSVSTEITSKLAINFKK